MREGHCVTLVRPFPCTPAACSASTVRWRVGRTVYPSVLLYSPLILSFVRLFPPHGVIERYLCGAAPWDEAPTLHYGLADKKLAAQLKRSENSTWALAQPLAACAGTMSSIWAFEPGTAPPPVEGGADNGKAAATSTRWKLRLVRGLQIHEPTAHPTLLGLAYLHI